MSLVTCLQRSWELPTLDAGHGQEAQREEPGLLSTSVSRVGAVEEALTFFLFLLFPCGPGDGARALLMPSKHSTTSCVSSPTLFLYPSPSPPKVWWHKAEFSCASNPVASAL